MTDDLVNKPHFIKFIECFKFALQLELVSRTVGDSQRPLCHRQHAPRWRYHRDTFPKAFQQVGSQRPLPWHDRNAFVLPLRHHWKPSHGAILSRPYGNYHVILQWKHLPWSVDSSSFSFIDPSTKFKSVHYTTEVVKLFQDTIAIYIIVSVFQAFCCVKIHPGLLIYSVVH